MLRRKKCRKENDSELEACVLCGCVTNIPKSMPIEKRWGYLPGAGQLCRDCAIQIAAEEQAAMKRGFVYSLPVYGGKGEQR